MIGVYERSWQVGRAFIAEDVYNFIMIEARTLAKVSTPGSQGPPWPCATGAKVLLVASGPPWPCATGAKVLLIASGPPWPCATGAKVLLIERFPRARRPRGWRADFEIAAFLIAKLCFRRNKSAGEHLYLQNFASDGASPSGS